MWRLTWWHFCFLSKPQKMVERKCWNILRNRERETKPKSPSFTPNVPKYLKNFKNWARFVCFVINDFQKKFEKTKLPNFKIFTWPTDIINHSKLPWKLNKLKKLPWRSLKLRHESITQKIVKFLIFLYSTPAQHRWTNIGFEMNYSDMQTAIVRRKLSKS